MTKLASLISILELECAQAKLIYVPGPTQDIQRCSNINPIEDSKTVFLSALGKWPDDKFCIAVRTDLKVNNEANYTMTVNFNNIRGGAVQAMLAMWVLLSIIGMRKAMILSTKGDKFYYGQAFPCISVKKLVDRTSILQKNRQQPFTLYQLHEKSRFQVYELQKWTKKIIPFM